MRPFWIVCVLTGAWAACVMLGMAQPRYYVPPPQSGWGGGSASLSWMTVAAVVAVVSLIVVLVQFRKLWPWGVIIGTMPVVISAASVALLVVAV